MRGREDSLGVFIVQGEAPVPASILLQDLNHVSKVKGQERVVLMCPVRVDNCKDREGGKE